MNLNYLRYKFLKPFKSCKNKYLKYITRREARIYDLYNQAALEISEYTGEPPETVKQKHKAGPQSESNFKIFENQKGLSAGEVGEFYRKCSYYIYELPLWNAEVNRPKYLCLISLPYLRRNGYQKVLDFGAGAGDFCIELAGNSLEVTYCDIGDQLYNLARWRFAKRNLAVKMAKGIDSLASADFDCIFSFDAFEHIKDLSTMLKKIAGCLRPGGSLIFSGAFSGKTLHLEENEQYDEFKNLDNLMQGCGLAFEDRFAQFYFYKHRASKNT